MFFGSTSSVAYAVRIKPDQILPVNYSIQDLNSIIMPLKAYNNTTQIGSYKGALTVVPTQYNSKESEQIVIEYFKKEVSNMAGKVTIDENVMTGLPVVSGTRIPIYLILSYLADGYSMDDLLNEFPFLSKDDIKSALEYSAKILSMNSL